MVNVSWDDCQEFCEKTRLSLPTEAQWEYACRAGTSGPFSGTGELDDMAWYAKGPTAVRVLGAHPVGEKQPNNFGLHDMHGNAYEWCEDWYQGNFYQESAGARDPLCENSGSERHVFRGGVWSVAARRCRSSYRASLSSLFGDLGLRPVWSSP